MPDVSIYHNIGISKQVKTNCCWFTCLSTVHSYCVNTGRTPCPKDPADDPVMKGRFLMNFTIPWDQSVSYATRLGYTAFAASPALADLQKMLSKAPVIFGGKWNEKEGHWLVINGLSGDQLSYYDPLTGRHVCNWVDFFSGDATDLHAHAEEPLFYVK
jgi:hypothetical protein